jgi:hypothetical protein
MRHHPDCPIKFTDGEYTCRRPETMPGGGGRTEKHPLSPKLEDGQAGQMLTTGGWIGVDHADTVDSFAMAFLRQVPESILTEAERLVSGDRRKEYGHPADNFRDVATVWSVILGTEITPANVIDCMIALKICRAKQSGWKRDTYVDIAGYAKCRQLVEEKSNGEQS